MFGRNRKPKKEKKKKSADIYPERAEMIRSSISELGGAGAGLCAGMVIDAGLNMIPCPAVKPVAKTAFKVGKFVISGIAGKLVSDLATAEIKEMSDNAVEMMDNIRTSRIPVLEESSEEKTEETDEQTYEIDE